MCFSAVTTSFLAVVSLRLKILKLYQDQLVSEGCSKAAVAQNRATLSRQLNELETWAGSSRLFLRISGSNDQERQVPRLPKLQRRLVLEARLVEAHPLQCVWGSVPQAKNLLEQRHR